MKIRISAIVLTRNEEKNIADCLKNLMWCDESIVIDDNSTDNTVKIAEKSNAKVYSRSLESFSNQRNFGITKANGEWLLFVDADERISDALAFEISSVLSNWTSGTENEFKGFYIPRNDIIWGKELKYGESGIKLLRLAKKNYGNWIGKVHEKWIIDGKVGLLKNSIIHYPHQSAAAFLKEVNDYTELRAQELYAEKREVSWLSIVIYPIGKFINNFILKKGFLDGEKGLIVAIIMSFHSFLVRGKLWSMWNKK
ncbi:MAG: glycosyltransferase family 2 protein [Candidatus Levybacteria bacterium]|nr:glycosyltransferase family 2 protein [Candidatus Levybacteria bacterium]